MELPRLSSVLNRCRCQINEVVTCAVELLIKDTEPVQDSDGGVKLEMTSLYSFGPGGDDSQPLGVLLSTPFYFLRLDYRGSGQHRRTDGPDKHTP